MPVISEVRFTSQGEECAGTLYLPDAGTPGDADQTNPADAKPAGQPAVVLAHGFTGTRRDGLPAFAERFAAAGFAALTFDYRGFGDSGGRERQVLSIRRELEDVASALAFIRGYEGIDPGRVALWGSSLGGGLTFETAAGDPAIPCAIAQVPFTDGFAMLGRVPPLAAARLSGKGLKDLAAAKLGRPRVMVPAAGEPGTLAAMSSEDALPGFEAITPADSGHENRVNAGVTLDILRWRPGRRAARIGCPILIQVAENDRDVPTAPALRAAGAAPLGELRTYACGHFDVYNDPWLEPVATDQIDFLKRHL